MNRYFQRIVLAALCFSGPAFGFSETELDSLESTGKKRFSARPWRTELHFSLKRNLEVRSRYSRLLDPGTDTSLLDLSNLYYGLNLNLNYSLADGGWRFDFLKNGEFFLSASFDSPFAGHQNTLINYTFKDYIQYALGDIITGLTVPLLRRGGLLSDLSLGVTAVPLSRFSREAGLQTTVDGTVSLLYFIKKGEGWSLSASSGHNIAYSKYNKPAVDIKGTYFNIPWDTGHSASLIYRHSRGLSVRIFTVYYLGIDTKSTRRHDLSLGAASSYKLKDRLYLTASLRVKDTVRLFNPDNKNIYKREPLRLLNRDRTFFVLGCAYSF